MAAVPTIRELVSAEEPVPPTMTVDQYLSRMFHPDVDFVDGRIEERNVGEYDHSNVQKMLLRVFLNHETEWSVEVLPECGMQITPTRFRVPDVMVLRSGQKVVRFVREAPLICIEVMSPEDTWKRLRSVLGDYLSMGVEHIWAFDPEERTAYRFDRGGLHRITEPELSVPGTPIRIGVADVFSLLDQK